MTITKKTIQNDMKHSSASSRYGTVMRHSGVSRDTRVGFGPRRERSNALGALYKPGAGARFLDGAFVGTRGIANDAEGFLPIGVFVGWSLALLGVVGERRIESRKVRSHKNLLLKQPNWKSKRQFWLV
jgi:hypothetical protein